jgi:hypothetical protein
VLQPDRPIDQVRQQFHLDHIGKKDHFSPQAMRFDEASDGDQLLGWRRIGTHEMTMNQLAHSPPL